METGIIYRCAMYMCLKTVSKYQYLLVNGYSEEQNQWKQDGIDEAWVAP